MWLFLVGSCPRGTPILETHVGNPALYVRAVGAGPTVVVVHGGPGGSHDHLRALERWSAEGRRVVTWDQRGVGRSAPILDSDAFALSDYTADLHAVLTWVGEEPVDLVGHSWGGLLAWAYTLDRPGNIRSLTLVGPAGFTRDHVRRAGRLLNTRRQRLEREDRLSPPPLDQIHPSCTKSWPLLVAGRSDPDHDTPWEHKGTCNSAINVATWMALGDFDLAVDRPARMPPSLVVFGKDDPMGVNASAIADALGTDDPTWLWRCGHRPMHECPDRFDRTVLRFLADPHRQN